MGRPNICCGGCTPPIVTCYIEDEVFYYEISNAKNAYFDYFGNSSGVITLDEDGYASGQIDTENPNKSTFTVVASNDCGTATCVKTCYYVFCYYIYKLGDVDHICSGSNRLDSVTLEFFINSSLLQGGEYPPDLPNAKFYINGQQVSAVEQTKLVPCAVLGQGTSYVDAVLTGMFGQATFDRCSLADVYVLTIDIDGECGPPLETFYGIAPCSRPWSPRFIDKKNTAIVEIDLQDGFNHSNSNTNFTQCPNPSISSYCFKYSQSHIVTGLSSFNGTFMLPLKCSTKDRLRRCTYVLPPSFTDDGQDVADTKMIAIIGTEINGGLITEETIQEQLYPYGYDSSLGRITYEYTKGRYYYEGIGKIRILQSDSAGTGVVLGVEPTKSIFESYSESRSNGDVYISQSVETYTWLPRPWIVQCGGSPPFGVLMGSFTRTNSTTKNGVFVYGGTTSGDFCSKGMNTNFKYYMSAVPSPPLACKKNSDGVTYQYYPTFNNTGLQGGAYVLNPALFNINTNPDGEVVQEYCYAPYIQSSVYTTPTNYVLIPPNPPPVTYFGKIRGWYECL